MINRSGVESDDTLGGLGAPPLLNGNVLSFLPACIDLPGTTDPGIGIVDHFFPVGNPARHAADGKEYGKHVDGETQGHVDETTIEINVGIELATDEVFILEYGLFETQGDVQKRLMRRLFF